jgi:quercetin dioxygenase-like cupin family protein
LRRALIERRPLIQGEPSMSLTVRRVVTGHDKNGRAIVSIDETVKNVAQTRPGANAAVIWTNEGFPVDNDGDADTSGRKVGTTLANGAVFRVVSFGPGVAPRNHRTDSIDYAVVISGEIDMELDDTTVHLKAGDVLVQRGTIHNWVNKGTAPCVIAFVLVAAKPVTAGGKVLNAVG